MKNLLDEAPRQGLLERLGRLSAGSQRTWGRMDVGQMLCHVADPLRIALGDMAAADASNVFTRSLLKWLVLAGMPAPKGKVQTFPELDQVAGGGTPPAGFAEDLSRLRALLDRFVDQAAAGRPFVRSPGFGRLSARSYGRLMYVHMDHHLRQFGV